MELYELHVCHRSLGTIDHRDTITCGNNRVRGGKINGTTTTCAHHSDLGEIGVHLGFVGVEDISAIALDMWRAAGHTDTQMVLGDDLHSEMVFFHLDVGMTTHSLHQSTLNLRTSVVSMVENAELRVSALTMQVEVAFLVLVEVYTPIDEFLDLLRSIAYHLLHRLAVGDIVTGDNRVGDMLVEGIYLQIGDTCHTTLCKRGVRLVQGSLAD